MGRPSPPERALLFIAALYSEERFYEQARAGLVRAFGEPFHDSCAIPWEYSDYYRDELGWPIYRRFLSFREPVDPASLRDIKVLTNRMEEELSVRGRRRINLDPGYLTLSKVVLATTKDRAHRVYLGDGIYAEATLVFRNGRYRPHEFTYRDYRSEEYGRFFLKMRQSLKSSTRPG